MLLASLAVIGCKQEAPPADPIIKEPANLLLTRAKAKAKGEKKSVFVVIGATWCQPCHELEERFAKAPIKDLLRPSYEVVRLKILPRKGRPDEVNPGALELYHKWSDNTNPGVPFYVVLDMKGKVLATSQVAMDDGSKVNLPGVTGEAGDHLLGVLRKTARQTPKPALDTYERWLQKN